MAFAPINPTQITPPRVDFIDERTGAISREWYRFLLSLKDSAQTSQDAATLGPDSTSLTVSYSAMLDTLAQATGSQSTGASVDAVAAVQTQVQDLASQPTSASVDAVAAVQTQVQDLASQSTGALIEDVSVLQTQVQDLALSLQADIQSYLAPVWSAVQDLSLTPSVIPSVGSMVYPAAGIANSTGSAWGTSYATTGSGTVVVLAASPIITGVISLNGSVKPLSVTAAPSAGTVTPASDTSNQFNYDAITGAYTIAAPSGSPVDGQVLILRFRDTGTVATFTWNAIYRIIGTVLPTTTVAGKTTYVGCKYNAIGSGTSGSPVPKWDVIAVAQEA
jgi:hypothetical protein